MQINHGTNAIAQQIANTRSLSYTTNERTAGSIAVWDFSNAPASAKTITETNLSTAKDTNDQTPSDFASALLEAEEKTLSQEGKNENFGFGDFFDIANPLQHLPVIGTAYRAITGDEIKQSSQIIGGALYGGAAGAALNIASAALTNETGKTPSQHLGNLFTANNQSTQSAAEVALTAASQPAQAPSEYLLSFTEEPAPTQPKQAKTYAHENAARYND